MLRTVVIAAGLAGAALAAQTAGRVEVTFVEPARFTDAGQGSVDTGRTTRSLEDWLKKLGQKLPDGRTLTITVTDIDLAGWVYPGRVQELRVLRGGADWPRIDLRWELAEGGRVLKSGEESLRDLSYLQRPSRSLGENDLPYEKRLLAEWFDARFVNTPD